MKRFIAFLTILALPVIAGNYGHGGGLLPSDSTGHGAKSYATRAALVDSLLAHWNRIEAVTQGDSLRGAKLKARTIPTAALPRTLIVPDSARNEGTLRQKGTATFGATATPVYITSAGAVGVNTASPQHSLSIVANGIGTGLHIVNSTINKLRTTVAQATDSASVTLQVLNIGNPLLRFRALNGDSLTIGVDGSNPFINAQKGLMIKSGTTSFAYSSNSIYPNTVSGSSVGYSETIPWGTGYFGNLTSALFKFASNGDAASYVFMVGDTTQNLTTSTTLALDGIAHTSFISVAAGSCHYFEAMVVGKVISGTDAGMSCAYKLTGVIDRTVNTTTLYGYAQTIIYENAGIAAACDAVASADDTNDRLVITVNHATGHTDNVMRWVARVTWVNVGG